MALGDGLDGVAQQLADDVFQMAEDVREVGVQVAVDVDMREGDVGTVGALEDGAHGVGDALHDVFGVAFEEDLADEFGFGELRAGGEPGGVEGVGEGEVLLGDDASGDALWCVR